MCVDAFVFRYVACSICLSLSLCVRVHVHKEFGRVFASPPFVEACASTCACIFLIDVYLCVQTCTRRITGPMSIHRCANMCHDVIASFCV